MERLLRAARLHRIARENDAPADDRRDAKRLRRRAWRPHGRRNARDAAARRPLSLRPASVRRRDLDHRAQRLSRESPRAFDHGTALSDHAPMPEIDEKVSEALETAHDDEREKRSRLNSV